MLATGHILAFFQNLGWPELMIIGVIALLIFGRRLPEVGRSLGKGIVEFKKGLQDTGDEIKGIPSSSQRSKSIGSGQAEQPDAKKSETSAEETGH